MPGPDGSQIGLADSDLADLAGAVLSSWDAFLEVVRAPSTDLDRPSRLPGWTGREMCVHLGSWPDHRVLENVLSSVAEGGRGPDLDPDQINSRLVAAHRDASIAEVLGALVEAREAVAGYLRSESAALTGTRLSGSAVGPLPALTLLHAACYELAVHALDLRSCGAPEPPAPLLDRGLAALMDVTGALSSRAGVHLRVTAQGPDGGWSFTSEPAGWSTRRTPAGRFSGTGVRGSMPDLLDTSAGRTNLGQLLLTRRLSVQELPSFMRLAPLLSEVPGLPGGAALRTAVAGLGSVTRFLGRLRGG